MLKLILLAIPVLIVVLVILVALRPAEYQITRSATLDASREAVFAQVNDFHLWEAWSPWAKLDATMKQTYEGAACGTGAKYSWAGNSKVGEGRMTITESRPGELVRINLEFLKPFPSTCLTEFSFKPAGRQTSVTWTMSGRHSFVPKAFGLFVNMDKMIGGQFEQGLAQLKSVVEGKGPPRI